MNETEPGTTGKIILLNGASSSGKSSIALALQTQLVVPFWHISIDHLRDAGVLPLARIRTGEFNWSEMREAFFVGFERSIAAYASAGNNLIVEYIFETQAWLERFLALLNGFDLFFVGVHCSLEDLEARERSRGDRPIGDARRDYFTVHQHCRYDFEVNSSLAPAANAKRIIEARMSARKVLQEG